MILLGIDTSTAQVGVAVGTADGILGDVRLTGRRRHAEQLAPAIHYVLGESGVAPSELAAVAVGVGPGLFTGLRVGVTTAKVLAQALRIPVVPVGSLDLLAHPLRFARRLIVPVMDARRGEVFTAAYRQVPGGIQRVAPYRVVTPEGLAADLDSGRDEVLLVGDGALLYRTVLADVRHAEIAGPAAAYPSPAALLQLASARFEREEFVPHWDVEPLYLRKPDAVPQWEQR